MASLSSARRRLHLGAHSLVLASAALWALQGCKSSGSSDGHGGAGNAGSVGTCSSPGGASGTGVAAGGATASGNSASGGAAGEGAASESPASDGTAGDGAAGEGTASGGTASSAGGSAGAAQSGDCTSAGGAGSLMVTNTDGKYALAFKQTYIEIDPANGARITALRVGGATGMNLILDQTVNAGTGNDDNWGSTFWPSPQTWDWPPTSATSIGAINTSPYTAVMNATSVTLTSGIAAAPTATVSVIKKFSADLAKEAIVVDYTVTNGGNAPVDVAPWEITRVPGGGITFYGTGMDAPRAGNFPLPLPATITTGAGATWYKHDPADLTDRKLLADGTGWLAHAEGDLLLVKSFPDVPLGAAATNEAEIEIYASQTGKYVEVEQQGSMQTLAPGAALHWTVRWYARKLSSPAAVGSAALVTLVKNLIQ